MNDLKPQIKEFDATIYVRVPASVKQRLERQAKLWKMKVGDVYRKALEHYLDQIDAR